MILATAVLIGLAAALVRFKGQALNRIASIPLQWAWLVLLAVVLQIPLLRAPGGPPGELRLQQWLFLASHLLLLIFVWRNRHLPGIVIAGVGVLCNLVVILSNSGWMPITPETLIRINPASTLEMWEPGTHYGYSKDMIQFRKETRLWILSDILILGPPFPLPTAFSIGDVLISIGIIVFLLDIRFPGQK